LMFRNITFVVMNLLTLQVPCVQLVSQEKGDLAEQSSKSVYQAATATSSVNRPIDMTLMCNRKVN